MVRILVAIIRLTVKLGLQCHLGLILLQLLRTEQISIPDEQESQAKSIWQTLVMIPARNLRKWIPNIHLFTTLSPRDSQ